MNLAARGVGAALGGAAAMLLASCASTGAGSSNAPAPQGQAGTRDIAGIGTVLINKSGDTLYFTDSDQGGIRCTGDCLEIWLPATGGSDAKIAGLGTAKRPDNSVEQLTYQGKPLYAFSMDDPQRPGAGNNAKDSFGGTEFTWHVAIVAGTPSSSSSGGGGGYGGGGY